jgi:hypothetical protein
MIANPARRLLSGELGSVRDLRAGFAKSPAADGTAGRYCSLVARFPEGDVSGAVLGRLFELDEAAANPVRPKFRLMRCTA